MLQLNPSLGSFVFLRPIELAEELLCVWSDLCTRTCTHERFHSLPVLSVYPKTFDKTEMLFACPFTTVRSIWVRCSLIEVLGRFHGRNRRARRRVNLIRKMGCFYYRRSERLILVVDLLTLWVKYFTVIILRALSIMLLLLLGLKRWIMIRTRSWFALFLVGVLRGS